MFSTIADDAVGTASRQQFPRKFLSYLRVMAGYSSLFARTRGSVGGGSIGRRLTLVA
jgi:hypothetical protein